MPVQADLVAYLDALIAETAGTDLFEGPMPEFPDSCIAVTHYGGEAALDRVMGPSLNPPGVEVPHVQVMVRNPVMATAKARADAVHALLDGFNGTLSGRTYFNVESLDGEPFSLAQDQSFRWRWVANYRIQKARG